MNNYADFTLEDFIEDPWFRGWVLNPTRESDDFWQKWKAENSRQSDVIQQARILLLAVEQSMGEERDSEQIDAGLQDLMSALGTSREKKSHWLGSWSRAAAAVVLLTALSWGFYKRGNSPSGDQVAKQYVSVPGLKAESNQDDIPKAVFLSDGSIVVLEKGSTIRYPEKFDSRTRTVYLQGEAFFDIAKNKQRPFLVYANETVTRVLGTSFRIKANKKDNGVLVAVKTGRVVVFDKLDFDSDQKGVQLIPNEQIFFNRDEKEPEKTRVANPAAIASVSDRQELDFEDTPLPVVFRKLAASYNMKIAFDENLLSNCRITTQFKEETLKQRLEVICDAVDATYSIQDGRLFISGPGCGI